MICGILRIKQITAGGIRHIGNEEYRLNRREQNPDIDRERTHLNAYAYQPVSLYRAWQDTCAKLDVRPSRKGQSVMEQAVITASPDFFKALGWDREAAKQWQFEEIPAGILRYFEDALHWAERYMGKEHIISATIHFDETTPHMHIDFVPVCDAGMARKDVYEKDSEGKLVRDERGHAVRARDEAGKIMYEYVQKPARLSRDAFWQQRGGRNSYRKMQDDFYNTVSRKYGLERGVAGSDCEHMEQSRYKAEKIQAELKQLDEERKRYAETPVSTFSGHCKKRMLSEQYTVSKAQVEEMDVMQRVLIQTNRKLQKTEEAYQQLEQEMDTLKSSHAKLRMELATEKEKVQKREHSLQKIEEAVSMTVDFDTKKKIENHLKDGRNLYMEMK